MTCLRIALTGSLLLSAACSSSAGGTTGAFTGAGASSGAASGTTSVGASGSGGSQTTSGSSGSSSGSSGASCGLSGQSCANLSCCSGTCANGICACTAGGGNCQSTEQCCSAVCSGGVCAACNTVGELCTTAANCCSGNCANGVCGSQAVQACSALDQGQQTAEALAAPCADGGMGVSVSDGGPTLSSCESAFNSCDATDQATLYTLFTNYSTCTNDLPACSNPGFLSAVNACAAPIGAAENGGAISEACLVGFE